MDARDATQNAARLDPAASLLSTQLFPLHFKGGSQSLPDHRSAQEQLLYRDLLGLIVSGRSNYIRAKFKDSSPTPSFEPSKLIDNALSCAILPLLDLAAHHLAVQDYAGKLSDLNMGRVNQALGASLSKLCRQLVTSCCELEFQPDREPFGLQDLTLALAPMIRKFQHAAAIVQQLEAANSLGGGVLNLLSQRLETVRGSAPARELLTTLLTDASQPFLEMLIAWIFHGHIDDPFNEFMVRVQSHNSPLSQDWDKYTVDTSLLPLELDSSDLYNQVLLAGKYINVIADCQEDAMEINELEAPISLLDKSLLSVVQQAYQLSNQRLLALLEQRNLAQRLVEFKHTFFLDNSDFLPTFLETVRNDLYKPAHQVNTQKLQYALDIAIQQPGSISSEQHLGDLKVSLASTALVDELLTIANVSGVTMRQLEQLGDNALQPTQSDFSTGTLRCLHAIQLDFDIPFPQNLVISKSCVLRYQFLFRLFLTLRTMIDALNVSWTNLTKSSVWRKQSKMMELEQFKFQSAQLRARILDFFQVLLYYCTTNVIETNWRDFFNEIHKCKTVDALQVHHLAFLDKCMKECLLTRPTLLKCQSKLFKSASMFAEFLSVHNQTLACIDPTLLSEGETLKPLVHTTGIEYTGEELLTFLVSTVEQYDQSFHKYVQLLLDELNSTRSYDNSVLRVLAARLEPVFATFEA